MKSDKDFGARSFHTRVGQPRHMQAFKGTKLGPKVKQGMDKGLRSTTFKGQQPCVQAQAHKRELN